MFLTTINHIDINIILRFESEVELLFGPTPKKCYLKQVCTINTSFFNVRFDQVANESMKT